MTTAASFTQRKRIKEKLPHELLTKLYLNSRVSIKQLQKRLVDSLDVGVPCLHHRYVPYDGSL